VGGELEQEYVDRWIRCRRTASIVSGLPFSRLDWIVETTYGLRLCVWVYEIGDGDGMLGLDEVYQLFASRNLVMGWAEIKCGLFLGARRVTHG
jgi:hypothetical protein